MDIRRGHEKLWTPRGSVLGEGDLVGWCWGEGEEGGGRGWGRGENY